MTEVKVPVLMGAGREMCWQTVQLGKVAAFVPIDYGVGGFGAMMRSIESVKVRSMNRHTFLCWGSYDLFTIFLSWVGLVGGWERDDASSITRMARLILPR